MRYLWQVGMLLAWRSSNHRDLTRRSGGRSLQGVVERPRPYIQGWKAYFRLVQMPSILREKSNGCAADCRRFSSTMATWFDYLTGTAGLWPDSWQGAQQVAANIGGGEYPPLVAQRRAEVGAGIAYFDRIAHPTSPDLNLSNRPVRTRMPGGMAGA